MQDSDGAEAQIHAVCMVGWRGRRVLSLGCASRGRGAGEMCIQSRDHAESTVVRQYLGWLTFDVEGCTLRPHSSFSTPLSAFPVSNHLCSLYMGKGLSVDCLEKSQFTVNFRATVHETRQVRSRPHSTRRPIVCNAQILAGAC